MGSSSDARRKLLLSVGLNPLTVVSPKIDESSFPNELPVDYVKRMALGKCRAIKLQKDHCLITADTIVSVGRRILHKTNDKVIAKQSLLLLNGRRHNVYTSFCIKKGPLIKQEVVKTKLKMKKLSEFEIDRYISTNEWINKAGSYSIQGVAIVFFPFISGCFSNVVGLPLPKLFNTLNSLNLSIKK